mgnify:CR=1 FL=1
MSTRSQIEFYWENPINGNPFCASIYHHFDGYPEERLHNIQATYDLAIEHYKMNDGYEYRVKDLYPTDIAAFYILANKKGCGDVEIGNQRHGGIEYLYKVWALDGVPYVEIISAYDGTLFTGTLEEALTFDWVE